jgi:hypothetical protein
LASLEDLVLVLQEQFDLLLGVEIGVGDAEGMDTRLP